MNEVIYYLLLEHDLCLIVLHLQVNDSAQIIECLQLVAFWLPELIKSFLQKCFTDDFFLEESPLFRHSLEFILQVDVSVCDQDCYKTFGEYVPLLKRIVEGLIQINVE